LLMQLLQARVIGVLARRMRIVAADARAHHALLGVGYFWCSFDRLSPGEFFTSCGEWQLVHSLCGARRSAQNVEVGVTRAAGHRRLSLEIMRPVTPHTFAMSVLKERELG